VETEQACREFLWLRAALHPVHVFLWRPSLTKMQPLKAGFQKSKAAISACDET
jgi:hypothetical protein